MGRPNTTPENASELGNGFFYINLVVNPVPSRKHDPSAGSDVPDDPDRRIQAGRGEQRGSTDITRTTTSVHRGWLLHVRLWHKLAVGPIRATGLPVGGHRRPSNMPPTLATSSMAGAPVAYDSRR